MVWHPDQSGLPDGCAPVHPQPAGHRRGAHLVDHLPLRRDRRREPDPHGRADPVRRGPGAGAQRPVREDPLLPQADRTGDQRPADRAGDGRAGRPVHARRPGAHAAERPAAQPGPPARVRADRPHHGRAGQGQLRDPLRPRAGRLGADHLPVVAHRDQRDRGRPVRPVHPRRRPGLLLRHLHRLRRPGDPARRCSRPRTSSTSR